MRRISRVWTRRSSSPGDDAFPDYDFEHDGVPFYGGNPSMLAEAGLDSVAESVGDDDDDISAFARETRVMSEMMGQPIDAEFDSALRHIEQGADPDDVFGEMDALAENSAVDDDV